MIHERQIDKAMLVDDWPSLTKQVRRISPTHYNAILPLKNFSERHAFPPGMIADQVLADCISEWRLLGKAAAPTIERSVVRYWNDLVKTHGLPLPPLSPVETPRSKKSDAWNRLPISLREQVTDFVGPTGREDPPTRERTNLLTAADILTVARRPLETPADLLDQAALLEIVSNIETDAKRRGVLETLAALAKNLGDDEAHERCRRAISDHVSVRGALDVKSSDAVDEAIGSFQILVTGFVRAILAFSHLPVGGRIHSGTRVETRKEIGPRAQHACAALLILMTQKGPAELVGYRFAGPRREMATGERATLVDATGETLETLIGDAARQLIDRLYAAMATHGARAPDTLFDRLKPGSFGSDVHSAGGVGSGIKAVTTGLGYPLTVQQLMALAALRLARHASRPTRADAAVGSGQRQVGRFTQRYGADLDADLAGRFADAELGDVTRIGEVGA